MSNLTLFENEEFGSVRAVEIGGEVLLSATDVAKALGYANPHDAVIKHCKKVKHLTKSEIQTSQNTRAGIVNNNGLNVIGESDIYRLAFGSKLPNAEKFTDWVVEEVLPSIRKYGAYATPTTIENIINNPDFGIQLLQTLKAEQDKNKRLELENKCKQAKIEEQKDIIKKQQSRITYLDVILQSPELITTSLIAKNYGMSAREFNILLNKLGIQYKIGGAWVLYAKYQEKGYVHTGIQKTQKGKLYPVTKWKMKGHEFLYKLLKENGYLPLIEQDLRLEIENEQ